jgi:hypothetical protein
MDYTYLLYFSLSLLVIFLILKYNPYREKMRNIVKKSNDRIKKEQEKIKLIDAELERRKQEKLKSK